MGTRTVLIGTAYNNGDSLERLLEQHQVKAGTVIDHLTKYALAGKPLRHREDLLPVAAAPEDQQAALAAFEEFGVEYLKPVFEKLNGRVSYEDLRILRLRCLAR